MLEALLQDGDPAILATLAGQRTDPREVHADVRRALGTGEDRSWEGILITPRVRAIIVLAEAASPGRDVEPFDLFEALRREGGSLAAEILRSAAGRKPAAAQE